MNLLSELIFPIVKPSHVLLGKNEAYVDFKTLTAAAASITRGCGGAGEELAIN